MALPIACPVDEQIDLDAFFAALADIDIDGDDPASLAEAAPLLKRLSNNPDFLADCVIESLESRFHDQVENNDYGMQVLMLGRLPGCFVRANFWPAVRDDLYRKSGANPFFYGLPHDHNFSFLTVGHFGPGYRSDYFEYEAGEVAGYPGERVNLVPAGRRTLSQGDVLLYRAHRDVHRQLPPERLSVSLNIVATSAANGWHDQYRFDLERRTIGGILNRNATEALLYLAGHLGGEGGRRLAEDFALNHPIDRIRYAAIRSIAASARSTAGRIRALETGCADHSPQVAELCRARLTIVDNISDNPKSG